MLTATSYAVGLTVYVLSALLALVLANLWFLRNRSPALKVFLSLPLAALLLTPAYIEAGAETLAPALVVAAFQWLSQGPEAASHAVRPLVMFTGLGFALGAVAGALLWMRNRGEGRGDPALDLSTDA